MSNNNFKSQQQGLRAENYFSSILNGFGISHTYMDSWFDFDVNSFKVEVKSTSLSLISNHNKKKNTYKYKSGRYDFHDNEIVRERQAEQNIWVCLIVFHEGQFLIQGFVKAKELTGKRYISIPYARSLNLINLNDWIKEINRR